jgi:hypothetical protein
MQKQVPAACFFHSQILQYLVKQYGKQITITAIAVPFFAIMIAAIVLTARAYVLAAHEPIPRGTYVPCRDALVHVYDLFLSDYEPEDGEELPTTEQIEQWINDFIADMTVEVIKGRRFVVMGMTLTYTLHSNGELTLSPPGPFPFWRGALVFTDGKLFITYMIGPDIEMKRT